MHFIMIYLNYRCMFNDDDDDNKNDNGCGGENLDWAYVIHIYQINIFKIKDQKQILYYIDKN